MSNEELGHMGISRIISTWILSYSLGPDRRKSKPKAMVKDGVKVCYRKALGLLIFSFIANQESNSSVANLIQIRHLELIKSLNSPIAIRISHM